MKAQTRSLKALKKSNKAAILFRLMSGGDASRVSLAKETGLTTAAVTLLINELMAEGAVSEGDAVQRNSTGRREKMLHFEDGHCAAVSINIESDNTHVSVCTFSEVLEERIYPTSDYFAKGIDRLLDEAKELSCKYADRNVVGIGVGVIGTVDEENGVSVNSYGALENNCRIGDELKRATGLEVSVINNVRAQARALIMSADDDFMLIKHSPGIGCAVVTDGALVSGARERAGEIGHTVVKPGGELCRCGKRGCLEAYVSEMHISELYAAKTGNKLPVCEIYGAYGADFAATEIVDDCIEKLALSIGNAAMLLNPERVLVTGGIFSYGAIADKLSDTVSEVGFKGADGGGELKLAFVGAEKKIKAFSGARHIILKKIFEV